MKDNLQIVIKLKHNHVVFMASIVWDIYQILGKHKTCYGYYEYFHLIILM